MLTWLTYPVVNPSTVPDRSRFVHYRFYARTEGPILLTDHIRLHVDRISKGFEQLLFVLGPSEEYRAENERYICVRLLFHERLHRHTPVPAPFGHPRFELRTLFACTKSQWRKPCVSRELFWTREQPIGIRISGAKNSMFAASAVPCIAFKRNLDVVVDLGC